MLQVLWTSRAVVLCMRINLWFCAALSQVDAITWNYICDTLNENCSFIVSFIIIITRHCLFCILQGVFNSVIILIIT